MMAVAALAFDVFGTVVDWKGTIASEGRRLSNGIEADWDGMAAAWMRGYGKALGNLKGWANLDGLLSQTYFDLAPEFGLDELPEEASEELSTTWSRLRPWPDAAEGFGRLAPHYQLAALTNANTTMLASLARSSGLPWHELISAEEVRVYKPGPNVYRLALKRLGLPPEQVMMVAAHTFDLNAAHALGIKTALIARQGEPGSRPEGLDHKPEVIAPDLASFAEAMVKKS